MKEKSVFIADKGDITNSEILKDLAEANEEIKTLLDQYQANGVLIVLSFNDKDGRHLTSGTVLGNTVALQKALTTFIKDFNKVAAQATESLNKRNHFND